MIERIYPGVYLAEVPFEAKPIEGVPTTQAPERTDAGAQAPGWTDAGAEAPAWTDAGAEAPAWTDTQPHDPGIALVQSFAFLSQPLRHRADLAPLNSRYIGETEKNLNATLDAAQSTDVALHYDESESLFGKRP